MVKKIVATTIVVLLLFTSCSEAVNIQTYELTVGVNPDNTLVTKTVTGFKEGDIIIETDVQGNILYITDENGVKRAQGYMPKEVVGQVTIEEPVWVDKGYDFDKVHEIKRLRVDFWLPNVITGEEYYRERLAGSTIDRISSHNYYFNAGGQITFVPEEDDDTYILIGIVNNPNDYPVKGTVTASVATKSTSILSLPLTKTGVFPPGTSMVKMGSIKDLFTPEGIFYSDGFNWDGPTYYPPYARFCSMTVIEDILHAKYPSDFRQGGKLGGFIPVGDYRGTSVRETPRAVFTENGGMRFKYNFLVNYIGAKRAGGTWDNILQGQVYGSGVFTPETNKWDIITDNEIATPHMTLLFNNWGLDVPALVTGLYGDENILAKSKDGNMCAVFDRLWPEPVGVMVYSPGQHIAPNFGGWHKTFQNPTEFKGNMFDEWTRLGAIVNPKILNQPKRDVNLTQINSERHNSEIVGRGTYRTVDQKTIHNTYQSSGWMSVIPVIKTYPAFINRYEFVPISDNPDIVKPIVQTTLGWVVKQSDMARPCLIWESSLKSIDLIIKYSSDTDIYNWTPNSDWLKVQSQISPNDINNARQSLEITITYDNKLVAQDSEPGLSLQSNTDIEVAQTYLTDQGITFDSNKYITEKIKKTLSSNHPQQITITADPIWNLGTKKIELGNNDVVSTGEKTITVSTVLAQGSDITKLMDNLSAACEDSLDHYKEEAMLVSGQLTLPPNDLSKFNNLFSFNNKLVFSRKDGSRVLLGTPYPYPPIIGTSYLNQPLVVNDLNSLQLSLAPRTFTGCYRVYDKITNRANLFDL